MKPVSPGDDNKKVLAAILDSLADNKTMGVQDIIRGLGLQHHPKGQRRLESAIDDELLELEEDDQRQKQLKITPYGEKIARRFRRYL